MMKKLAWGLVALLAVFGVIVGGMLIVGVDFRDKPSIGSVDTAWKLLGTDHKVAIDAFEDPKVEGVACFISRSRIGGVTGALGLRADTSEASIACRQVAPIRFKGPLRNGERVFAERRSLLFKTLQVVRFYDAERASLVYLTYSDKLVDGSPKNSLSAVALMPWGNVSAERPVVE